MDHFVNYASSDDEGESAAAPVASPQKPQPTEHDGGEHDENPADAVVALPTINSAPLVIAAHPESAQVHAQVLAEASQKQLAVNLPVSSTLAPLAGPEPAFAGRRNPALAGSGRETVTGVVEAASMEDFSFDAQYHTYNQSHSGARRNRRGVGALDAIVAPGGETVFSQRNAKKRKNHTVAKERAAAEDFGDDAVHGVWAPQAEARVLSAAEAGTMTEAQAALRAEHLEAKRLKAERSAAVDEDMDFDRLVEKKVAHLLPARLQAGQEALPGTSRFLDEHEYDYQGRSWVAPPRGLKPDDDGEHAAFLPKRCVHKWAGHTKGVQAIELFPRFGHLLLSASMDHTVRIWDVYNERKCKRVYEGHSGAVRAINFSADGARFLSAGFDRFLHLWDTETGQSVQSFTNRRVPYCVKFYPGDNSQFVIGDSNNMVVQFDARSGEVVQEYNHHLQAVNSVTFVDDNRRFVSTSDDKKVLVWEWGIPVPIKYISEPSMHSMPAVTLHPSGGFFAGQALNNQIDVYAARDKFKLQRKKVFKGHSSAGYACQIGFSPNGQYIMSGDADGRVVFWDWKTTKLYKKLQAHDRGPCIGAVWHPLEPSKVVTCGWDGLIKYWD